MGLIYSNNKKFNKSGTNPYVPTPNANKLVENGGANVSLLQIKCWKCQGPHYARNYRNKTNGVLQKLQEELTVEDIAGTPWIYAAFDGRQKYHQATMVEIEGNILNISISILIDPDACRSYVSPKIVDVRKLGKVKHDKTFLVSYP